MSFAYTFYVLPTLGNLFFYECGPLIREGNGDKLRRPYKNDHFVKDAYDFDDEMGLSMAFWHCLSAE